MCEYMCMHVGRDSKREGKPKGWGGGEKRRKNERGLLARP